MQLGGTEFTSREFAWYTCGPTVYADAHLGHARTYVSVDIIQRVLRDYFGCTVHHVVNVTDIDDKIIAAAGQEHVAFARNYEKRFAEDLSSLECVPPQFRRVTENMDAIVSAAKAIQDRGFAYECPDGLYFDTEAFKRAGYRYDDVDAGTSGERGKKCGADFAIWKQSKPGEPSWESPWGRGRPGWHIECTALAARGWVADTRSVPVEVHAGGEDLRFPHHCNEIAQAEAAGYPFPRHWVHVGHLSIAGQKMSKSLKNFETIRDALESHTPRQLRLAFALHPWWEPMSWGDRMEEAKAKERAIESFLARTRALDVGARAQTAIDREFEAELVAARAAVDASLRNNVDISSALATLLVLVRQGNAYDASRAPGDPALMAAAGSFVSGVLRTMGLRFDSDAERSLDALRILHKQVRRHARDLFGSCDAARREMGEAGVQL